MYNQWNYRNGGIKTRKKIDAHRRLFERLWKHAVEVMEHCLQVNALVILEWPTNNLYWKHPKVVKFFGKAFPTSDGIETWKPVRIHGCAYGLKSKKGVPIKKPWTLMTNKSQTVMEMQKKCECYKAHDGVPPALQRGEKHAKCAGSETKPSENYPEGLANEFHSMFANYCSGISCGRST